MRRDPVLASEVSKDDLVIAHDNTRLRVTSTLSIQDRETVIIYGVSAHGEVGIAHGIRDAVIRLV